MLKAAVIVETRNLPDLVQIIRDHMRMLDESWGLHIFCSWKNYLPLRKAFPEARIFWLPRSRFSFWKYNRLLTSRRFWEKIKGDKVLVFQPDSMLLRKGVDEFLEWDYVGAPWAHLDEGGNGGLSLRSKAVMLSIVSRFPYEKGSSVPEDVYFCTHIREIEGARLAPREVCQRFACEMLPAFGTLGYHAIDRYLDEETCHRIRTQYDGSQESPN